MNSGIGVSKEILFRSISLADYPKKKFNVARLTKEYQERNGEKGGIFKFMEANGAAAIVY